MKTVFRFAALCCMVASLGFTSCQVHSFDDEESQTTSRTFTFSLFSPSASRASSIADFKKIVVMDIVDGNIKQVIQQASSDNGFGSPSITLENGTHTLRFIATDAEGVSFNGSTLSQSPLGDTFVQTVTLNTKEAEINQRVVLGRNVARIVYEGGARCLCYDRPEDYRKIGSTEYGTGKYYTFTWADSNTGGTTVAGEKTKYSIKPVRTIPIAPIKAQFSLDADFTWDADTTNVITNK